jgi:hypothetical protein
VPVLYHVVRIRRQHTEIGIEIDVLFHVTTNDLPAKASSRLLIRTNGYGRVSLAPSHIPQPLNPNPLFWGGEQLGWRTTQNIIHVPDPPCSSSPSRKTSSIVRPDGGTALATVFSSAVLADGGAAAALA